MDVGFARTEAETCLDLWIEYTADGIRCANNFGTFKTLSTDDEAMHIMAALLADFIIEGDAYVNAHLDNFTWIVRRPGDVGSASTGVERRSVDVHVIEESGEKSKCGYSCSYGSTKGNHNKQCQKIKEGERKKVENYIDKCFYQKSEKTSFCFQSKGAI